MKKILFFLGVSFIIFVIGIISLYKMFPLMYYDEVMYSCEKYEIDPAIIFAIIKAESNFKYDAVSKKGAIGVMQIMPSTAEWYLTMNNKKYNKKQLYDYKQNIEIGIGYFQYLYNKFKDAEKTIAAYNAGPSRVEKNTWIKIKETKKYVRKVKIYIKIYRIILKIKKITDK